MSILNKKCLVLNAGWFPASVASISRSIKMVLKGRGKFIDTKTFCAYSFEEWIEKGVENENDCISTSMLKFEIPKVVMAINYKSLHKIKVPLNHPNVYKRDGHKCWYCQSNHNLTWDHIIPKCKFGKHCWENLITCCQDCNNEKDNFDADEFCQKKGCEIPTPKSLSDYPWLIEVSELPKEWLSFLKIRRG